MSTVTSALPQLPRASLPNKNVYVNSSSTGGSGSGTLPATTIAYAASITPDADSYGIYNVGTLTGAITINNYTGTPDDGQTITFRFIQDATGRAFTWGSNWSFGTDITAGDLPTTANANFEVMFRYNAVATKFRCAGLLRGF